MALAKLVQAAGSLIDAPLSGPSQPLPALRGLRFKQRRQLLGHCPGKLLYIGDRHRIAVIPRHIMADANVAFGGPKKNRLFFCGSTSLYATYLAISEA